MNFKRITRVLVCLVLVCALVVSISPIKARAEAVGALAIVKASTVTCNPYIVCAALLIACGVYAGVSTGAFEDIVYDCVEGMEIAGTWIKNGVVELLRIVDASGNVRYYVSGAMMESVRSWCLDSGSVSLVSGILTSGEFSAFESALGSFLYSSKVSSCYVLLSTYTDTKTRVYFSLYPFTYDAASRYYKSYDGTTSKTFKECFLSGNSYSWASGVTTVGAKGDKGSYLFGSATRVVSSGDVQIGLFPPTSIDGTSVRQWSETYANRGLYVVGGGGSGDSDGGYNPQDGGFFLPLALSSVLAALLAMTQEQQWTAETPREFEEYEESQEYEVTPAPEFEGYPSIEIKPVTTPDVDPGGSGSGDDGSESGDGEGTDYTSWFQKLIKTLEEIPTKFSTWFAAIVSFVQQFPTMFEEWMAAFPSLFESWLSDLKNFALEFPSLFEEWLNNVIGAIQEAPAQIEQWINGLPDRFAGYFENVQLGFASVVDAVTGVGEYIVNGIRSAITDALSFLFEPEEGFIESKVQALSDEFTFVSSIIATGKALTTGLSGVTTSPPIIYVDLGASNGSYNYGGKTVFMDLSWYAEYKPTVDIIISAFLWICFIWRLILKLPGIINGMPGDFVMGSAHLFGLDNHLPSRNAAYEIQRAENRNSVRRGPPK